MQTLGSKVPTCNVVGSHGEVERSSLRVWPRDFVPFTVEKAARDDGSMSPTPSSPNPEMYVLDSPYELDRWRPLAQWLLYVPHGLIVRALQSVSSVVFVIYWVIFLATGSLNRGLYGLMAMIERYGARSGAFLVGHSAVYPPFDFGMGPADNGAYAPVRLNLPDLPETVSRKAALNVLLAIPHYIVVAVYAIGAVVVRTIGWFSVLFTGRWPVAMRDWLVRFSNYYYRVWAFVTMVHTEYPRFGTAPV